MFDNKKNICFLFAAGLFVCLAMVGGIFGYSPVLRGDMWDGYLGFFTQVTSGDWMSWWAQHNEHRIVLSRIFFWIDLNFLHGQGWFLVCVNYALLLTVCSLFWRIWKDIEPDNEYSWIGYFLFSWLFWWIQNDNLVWGFQSQFILAQLLPLAGFYFLHRTCEDGQSKTKYFLISLSIGVLSVGSMANGLLVLPIMVIFAICAKMGWLRVVITACFAAFSVGIYFYDYKSPGGHGALGQAILTNPIGLLRYVLLYLGGPFSFGSRSIGLWTGTLAGLLFVISSIYFGWRVLSKAPTESLQLALLAFIFYVSGTAVGVAGGRLIFGVDQALSSRYMTPSLMAWGVLFFYFILIQIKSDYGQEQSYGCS